MANFLNVTGAELIVKDEYGRDVKFWPGETRTDLSNYMFKYTQAGIAAGMNRNSLGEAVTNVEPVLWTATSLPVAAARNETRIHPDNVMGADRTRKQVAVTGVAAAPAGTEPEGLYSNGTKVWLVHAGAVIEIA